MSKLIRVRTPAVAAHTGLTFRQLDYLSRSHILGPPAHGSGTVRHWPPDDVARLHVAAALMRAAPHGVIDLPSAARAVAAGPPVPDRNLGRVRLTPDGKVEYGADVDMLAPGIVAVYRIPDGDRAEAVPA